MRLETLLAGHALRRPGHPAIVCADARISYAELHDRVRRAAVGLQDLGVRAGERVIIVLPNGPEFVVALYAAFTLGAIAVPMNARLAPEEIEHILTDAQPQALIYAATERVKLPAPSALGSGLARIVVGAPQSAEVPFERLQTSSLRELPALHAEHDDALIMYTSGTTGKPKGAIVTHANMIVQNVFLHALEWGLDRDDRFLAINPLAHRAGSARVFNALGLGATLVIMEKFDPVQALALIERERITVTGLAPTVIRMMLPHLRERASSCASLRRVIVSTEAFPLELKREVLALLPQAQIHSLFGSTEVLATNLSHAEQFSRPESVGRPLPGVEVKLVDDAGNPVPSGGVGELLVRSGAPGRWATMRGYWNRPEETAATIRDGWVYTGDLARADAEGYLYIVDRKKDMVLSGGYNIYSKEVEQVLVAHPDVEDAAVIGVPDPIFGEAVAAFVKVKRGAVPSPAALIEHCRERLASYKKPKHVFVVEALPRNATGKVLKNELRARYAGINQGAQS